MTLTFNFQGQIWNLLYISQMVRLPKNEKQTYIFQTPGFKCDHQVWPRIFKVKYGICYLSQKWSDCHKTKNKPIDWTLCLKCGQWLWHWQWPWPWIVKVKYEICYFLWQNDQIATKLKVNESFENRASNAAIFKNFVMTSTLDFHAQIFK